VLRGKKKKRSYLGAQPNRWLGKLLDHFGDLDTRWVSHADDIKLLGDGGVCDVAATPCNIFI